MENNNITVAIDPNGNECIIKHGDPVMMPDPVQPVQANIDYQALKKMLGLE